MCEVAMRPVRLLSHHAGKLALRLSRLWRRRNQRRFHSPSGVVYAIIEDIRRNQGNKIMILRMLDDVDTIQ